MPARTPPPITVTFSAPGPSHAALVKLYALMLRAGMAKAEREQAARGEHAAVQA
jgi:hypothetical protein